ncbi:MAG: 16S rRNA (cytosine(1402)-N(4))-methyltransferase RsmH [Gammaproteobacteria bacterium]|nr:16S rRNA (cytosine(1402)-N(4))-methyltransferase RsmH [Gammaproteobacteria bacterium]NNF62468.1 16S rRNA (cytosine(1402)-N(4))-methyltransferase RsmH [Gammaproteobacteria bacterium]NNM21820.1 16S rRNA (cytosine(1402)-N(4))-methyltransferase RsmH [Gammaproteobacteria bacterium]
MSEHRPVLLHETLVALAVQPAGRYVDATYGRGGHAKGILQQLGDEGRLLVLDRDPAAIASAAAAHTGDERVIIQHRPFAELGNAVAALGWAGSVDGLLLDIGVSSPQLDEPQRGFSFRHDGPLDMRMDPAAGESAAEWLAHASEREIGTVLKELGEERAYKKISRAIVAARQQSPIETTARLAEIVSDVIRVREPGRHPATRVFQALRIYINDELQQLEAALQQSLDMLTAGGVLCVISFHSLEDRIVKRFMRRHAQPDPLWRGLPEVPAHAQPVLARPAKAVRAGSAEVEINPRSRSAVLRVTRRL